MPSPQNVRSKKAGTIKRKFRKLNSDLWGLDAMMNQIDKAALERAIELYRAGSRTQRQRIDAQLAKGDDWEDVATYCAFHMQMENLRLPPWQRRLARSAPGNMASVLADPDSQRGYRSAALLRQRMERCGVSRWHPNPVAACEAAERRTAT
jgi:hypothetical protein